MGDQALQEAIQRARQLAAKITQNQRVERPASTIDHSGPVKVTLAYEKPANHDQPSRQRSTSRDYNRNEPRDPMSGRSGEEKIEIIIPCAVIGLVIGKGGENIKRIQNESGATVRVDPNTVDEKGNKLCTITGTKNAVEEARIQVENVIENAATNKRPRMSLPTDGSDSFRMKIPASRTGAIIGKGGETIKSIKQQSGCEIELDKRAKDCGPDESLFILRGSPDKISKARSLIETRLAQGRDGRDRGGPRDMTAAWAAYFAQYSLLNQAGGQPGAPGMSVPQQPAGVPSAVGGPPMQQPKPAEPASQAGQTQDYSDQWIEYYMANGRPDYAEQIIQMKKQQEGRPR